MAITVYEELTSRAISARVKGGTIDFSYWVEGTNDEQAVIAYLLGVSAPTYSSSFSGELILTEIAADAEGPALWRGTVSYGDPDRSRNQQEPETGESEWSFDVSTGTEHIQLGLQNNIAFSAPGAPPAPAVDNIIGLSKDGNGVQVEGVDILQPRSSFSETHYLPATTVTTEYRALLEDLAAHTNNAPFRGRDTGEVLFVGASGRRRGRGDWAVTFSFEVSKNKANFPVGQINVGWKPGHEYLWVMYADQISEDQLIRKPQHAFVIPVYDTADFSQLGIGT